MQAEEVSAGAACGTASRAAAPPSDDLPFKRRSAWLLFSFLVATALALTANSCAPQPAHAAASTISGTCYVACTNANISGAEGGNVFAVRFPQYGIETTGYCISGPLYGTPLPGNYPFTGTRTADGGYQIVVDCSGAAMYDNHYSQFGAQNVGSFKIYLDGTVELQKRSDASYAKSVAGATLAGATYELVSSDGSRQAVLTTDADGRASAAAVPNGTYTIRETKPSHGYALDDGPQRVTVRGGQTTHVDSWENPLLGAVSVEKSSAAPAVSDNNPCYALGGAVYGVYSDERCTNQVQTITTNEQGAGTSKASLWPGSYWIKEIAAPEGYALDKRVYPVVLGIADCQASRVPCVRTSDEPQLAALSVVLSKTDAETGDAVAQGDATLAGAVFDVAHYAGAYDSAEEAEASGEPAFRTTVVTDEDGEARIEQGSLPRNGAAAGCPLGTLVVTEKSAPEGYLLPEDNVFVCPVTASGTDPLGAVFHRPAVPERVIRGDLALVKFGDGAGADDDTGLKQPLEDVAFDIVHKSSGSAVARIVTDEHGFASTEQLREDGQVGALPYGTYLVREDPSTVPEGYQSAPAFEATISENGQTLRYLVEDGTGTTVQVVKRDAETGNRIAGRMTFRILDADGQPVEFTTVYPTVQTVTELSTDENGSCTLPGKLNGSGTYYVQEVTAPRGYVLNEDPVPFRISGETAGTNLENPLVVTMENHPQKARLSLRKTDAETGGAVPLANTAWDVVAAEDVTTADGTVHARAGDVMAHLETDENGEASSDYLHLGSYDLVETQAPEGYVAAADPMRVHLTYGDQLASYVEVRQDVPNLPAYGTISLSKTAADTGDALAGAIYEVRATRDVVAADGTVHLHAGDVADTLRTDEDGTARSVPLHMGAYQVVEVQAPDGYLTDEQAHDVELAYEGQDVPLVEASLELEDEPVPVEETDEPEAPGGPEEGEAPDGTDDASGDAVLAETGDAPWIPAAAALVVLAALASLTAVAAVAARRRAPSPPRHPKPTPRPRQRP